MAEECLTEREVTILQFVADGLSNSEVAQQLQISIRTVDKHLENIYKKLDVKRRTKAISKALTKGLIKPINASPEENFKNT